MTSKWIIAIGVILILPIAFASFSRKSVRAETTIQVDPDQVWAVPTTTT